MRRVSLVIVSLTLMICVANAWAQTTPAPANPDPSNPFGMWNVEQMIDRATGQVVKRYSLTPEQEDYTRKLMAARVNAFLDKNEQPIREIFAEAIKYQLSGNPPPPEKVKEWTVQIDPMFNDAKGQILEGNREFREILSDEQRKIHDVDLKVMEQNFKDAEQRLVHGREGNLDLDFGHKPKARPAQPASQAVPQAVPPAPQADSQPVPPAAPTRAAPGRVVGPTASSVERSADYLEMYVRKFIDNYKLDQAQTNQAMQILAETKRRASEYVTGRKDEYEKLQSQMASVTGDQQAVAEINKQLAELNKPVQIDLVNEMKQRLDQIPTEAQRKTYEESQPKKTREQMAKGAASAPASQLAAASRPASSRPALTSRPALRRTPMTRPAAAGRTATSQPAAQR